eukprot:TRINITY_DN64945_c0_g1_i2.p1 TRINITY_DN64945_c0_g1~~TRINITY_DN64945_c0_g1_i2.p1  ORF type:complete len:956 (+),score=75.93 TRINITY_DN64945_c0_g1_i2:34-2868(+)
MANCCLVGVAFVLCLLSLSTNANNATDEVKHMLQNLKRDPAFDKSIWAEISSLKKSLHTSQRKAQKSAKAIVQWFDMNINEDAERVYAPSTLTNLVKLIRALIAYCDLPLEAQCFSNGDCNDDDVCTSDLCMEGECSNPQTPGCVSCTSHSDCSGEGHICTCEEGMCSDNCVEFECNTDKDCADEDPCTKDTCTLTKCLHLKITDCAMCEMNSDCNDWDPCTYDKCVGGACANLHIPNCDCSRVGGYLCEETETCVDNCNDCKQGYVGNPDTGMCCGATEELCGATGTYWCAKYKKCVPNCAKCGDDVFEASSGECVSDCAAEGMFLCPSQGSAAPCVFGCIDDCPGFEATNYERNTCEVATKASCIACHTYYCEVEKRCVEDCDECPDSTLNKGSKAMYIPDSDRDRFQPSFVPAKEPYCEPVGDETDPSSSRSTSSTGATPSKKCARGFWCSRVGGYVDDCCVECGDVPRENTEDCKCEFGWRPLEWVAKQWKTQFDDWENLEPADEVPLASAGRIIQMAALSGQEFPQCHYTLIIPKYMWGRLYYRNFWHLRPDEAYDTVMSWIIPDAAYTWDELLEKRHHRSLFGLRYETALSWPRALTEEGNRWIGNLDVHNIRPTGSTWDLDIYNVYGMGIVRNSFTLFTMYDSFSHVLYNFGSYRDYGLDGIWHDGREVADGAAWPHEDVKRRNRVASGIGQKWHTARILETDLECDGGYVHVIDNVLLPPKCEDRAHEQNWGKMDYRAFGGGQYFRGFYGGVKNEYFKWPLVQADRLASTPWLGLGVGKEGGLPPRLHGRRAGIDRDVDSYLMGLNLDPDNDPRDADDYARGGFLNYEQMGLFNYYCFPRMSCDANAQCDGFGVETCTTDPWGECGETAYIDEELEAPAQDPDDSFHLMYGPKCATYCLGSPYSINVQRSTVLAPDQVGGNNGNGNGKGNGNGNNN